MLLYYRGSVEVRGGPLRHAGLVLRARQDGDLQGVI